MGGEVGRTVVFIACAAVALTACGGIRPRSPEPSPATLTAQAGGPGPVPPAVPAPAPAGVPSPGSAIPADQGAAALNSRLLSRVSPPIPDADLPIGAGDLIEIAVFEVEELSKLRVRIPLRGTITLPLLGAIPAAGRSAIELEDEIRARLQQKYMHNPQVSVFVHEHQSQRISVIGAVRKGGVYTLSSRLRLADALALAEGLTDEADHVIYLVRRLPAGTVVRAQAGEPAPRGSVPPLPEAATPTEELMVPIDLDELAGGREDLNVPLRAGDVVNVPRAGSFYVGGSVERPGSYFLKSRMTVQQAIMVAGGVKDVADWGDIRLYRTKPNGEREVVTYDLNLFEKGQPPPEIQKSDVVVVGKSATKAFWYGVYEFFKGVLGLSKGI